jgi:hypothetical protein
MSDQPLPAGHVLIETYTGVTLQVTPLTLAARQAIARAVERQWPLPDPAAYERPSEITAFGDDQPAMIPASQHPDYIRAVEQIEARRARALQSSVLVVAVTHPQRDWLIQQHRGTVSAVRAIDETVYEDDWAATLQLVIASEVEMLQIYGVINRQLPLTEGEVREGVTYFRLALRADELRAVDREQGARRAARAQSRGAQRPDG